MIKYQVIEIVNHEPLKIGAGGNKLNQTEPSKDYIPGSTIRGAMINEWIRNGLFHDRQKDILQHVEFYNAYPYRNNRLYIPTPFHLRVDKHKMRELRIKAEISGHDSFIAPWNLIESEASEADRNHKGKEFLDFRFVSVQDDVLVGMNVEKEYRLHHSTVRKKDQIERDNLFRYQAMSSGQTFRSLIRFDETLEEPLSLILRQPLTVYMGGSKGSGYGLCLLQRIGQATSDYREAVQILGMPFQRHVEPTRHLVISCLSDCLFRNRYGQPVNYLPVEELSEQFGKRLKLDRQIVRSGLSEGYNTKWQARYPKESTLQTGSVLVYRFEDMLTQEEYREIVHYLEQRLHGHRTQDGYGWLGVNLHYPNQLLVYTRRPSDIKQLKDIRAFEIKTFNEWTDSQHKVLSILTAGMQPVKDRWFMLICDRSLNKGHPSDFIISEGLKRHHHQKMMGLLAPIIEDLKKSRKISLGLPAKIPDYMKDDRQCSIARLSFVKILEHISGIRNHHELDQFADRHMGDSRGKLYYFNFDANHSRRLFLAELLHMGLRIQHRRCFDEPSTESSGRV